MTVEEDTQATVVSEDKVYRWARERAEMLQGLYIHIMVFVVTMLGLFGINYATRGDDGIWWFIWPLLIWGIGLAIHVLVTVVPFFTEEWVERKTERIAATRR
jgi:fatty acid desaturase